MFKNDNIFSRGFWKNLFAILEQLVLYLVDFRTYLHHFTLIIKIIFISDMIMNLTKLLGLYIDNLTPLTGSHWRFKMLSLWRNSVKWTRHRKSSTITFQPRSTRKYWSWTMDGYWKNLANSQPFYCICREWYEVCNLTWYKILRSVAKNQLFLSAKVKRAPLVHWFFWARAD